MTVTINYIETKPEIDPYHRDTDGITQTIFWLNPEKRQCGVGQEYRTNSTTMDRWHSRELIWVVPNHPSEGDMREWVEKNIPLLEEICDSYNCEWNGNNHIGQYSEDAWQNYENVQRELSEGFLGDYWEVYTVEQWIDPVINEITEQTTDQELEKFVENYRPDQENIVVLGDILEYVTEYRDYMIRYG